MAGQKTRFRGPYGRAGCRACAALADAELSSTSPDLMAAAQAEAFKRVQAATRRTSWGGDCYAYGLLALGSIDVIVEPGLKVWDWAALVPVIEGAGGADADLARRAACIPMAMAMWSRWAIRRCWRRSFRCWPEARRILRQILFATLLLLGSAGAQAQVAPPVTQKSRHHDPRHAVAAGGLPELSVCEPERAERRRGGVRHGRQFRRVQPVHPARQRGDRAGGGVAAGRGRHVVGQRERACLGEPADRLGRRGGDGVRASGRDDRAAGGPDVGGVRDPAAGAFRRWLAGDGAGRGVDVQHADGEGPAFDPRRVGRM